MAHGLERVSALVARMNRRIQQDNSREIQKAQLEKEKAKTKQLVPK